MKEKEGGRRKKAGGGEEKREEGGRRSVSPQCLAWPAATCDKFFARKGEEASSLETLSAGGEGATGQRLLVVRAGDAGASEAQADVHSGPEPREKGRLEGMLTSQGLPWVNLRAPPVSALSPSPPGQRRWGSTSVHPMGAAWRFCSRGWFSCPTKWTARSGEPG